jgi:chromosome segregation ATPase
MKEEYVPSFDYEELKKQWEIAHIKLSQTKDELDKHKGTLKQMQNDIGTIDNDRKQTDEENLR